MKFGLGKAAGSVLKGGGAYGKSAGKGFVGLFTPVKTLGRMAGHSHQLFNSVTKLDMRSAGKASMSLLGTAAGVTYMTRAVRNGSMFKDRKGKKDILPFIPGI